MRLMLALAVSLAVATTTVAAEPVLLYRQDPWIVFRGEAAGNPICDARMTTDETFEILGNLANSVIRARRPAWHFEPRRGSVELRVGPDRKLSFGEWQYQGQYVALVAPTDVVDAITSGLEIPGNPPLEMLDETGTVIATFDIKGLGDALKAWRSCLDHWTDVPGNWRAHIS